MLALPHRHGHLPDADPVADGHHEPLDLGVVVRQVGGKERDRLAVQRLESRGRVGEALVCDPRDDTRQNPDPDPARFPAETKDVRFAKYLVEEIGVACVPGSSFYNDARDGASQVRFTFCKKESTLAACAEKLSKLRRK